MIGVIGDIHISAELPYADYVADRRMEERENVFKKILESFSDCEKVVLLGDSLNAKNNSSEAIKIFVDFLKKLGKGKKLYVLAGNHEKFADGRSAIDFLEKLNDEGIRPIIRDVYEESGLVFSPYIYSATLGTTVLEEARKILYSKLPPGNILFLHQAISETETDTHQTTELFNEIVLNRKELEKKYKLIFGGHIHKPQRIGNTIVAGSVFTHEVNETEKYIWKIDELSYDVEQIKLPCRAIIKTENPTVAQITSVPKSSIYKAVFTKKLTDEEMEKRLTELRKKDGYIVVEQYETERKKATTVDVLELKIPDLLKLYAEQNGVDLVALLSGYELIK